MRAFKSGWQGSYTYQPPVRKEYLYLDDLITKMKGYGPKLKKLLHNIEVYTTRDL